MNDYNNDWAHHTTKRIPATLFQEKSIQLLEEVKEEKDKRIIKKFKRAEVYLELIEDSKVLIRDNLIQEPYSGIWYLPAKINVKSR